VVGRAKRVHAEVVLDVGEDQLLVLLLVIQAELEQRGEGGQPFLGGPLEERGDAVVDPRAVRLHL
jgi:hypothetical protein